MISENLYASSNCKVASQFASIMSTTFVEIHQICIHRSFIQIICICVNLCQYLLETIITLTEIYIYFYFIKNIIQINYIPHRFSVPYLLFYILYNVINLLCEVTCSVRFGITPFPPQQRSISLFLLLFLNKNKWISVCILLLYLSLSQK